VKSIEAVAVIGAGTMGHGIAQVAAQAGCDVRLADAQPGAAEKGLERIRANLDGAVKRGKATAEDKDLALGRIRVFADARQAAKDCDLVIEAVPEQLAMKQDLLRAVEPGLGKQAIFASNTSSLSLKSIAEAAARPERVVGLHFFNPVHLMRLIEVVVHEGTDDRVRDAAVAFAQALGKEPIVVKDSPGFASSRLGIALGLEAMRMLEEGVASAEDIDKAMALGYNHPMGPLRLTDLVGLDVRLAIARYLHETLRSPVFEPPAVLERLVGEGKLGRKSGQGFYAWEAGT
jgi:3-hydroxybutyryl-CoA dehydrogenase